MKSLPAFLTITGAAYLAGSIALAVTQAPLGSPLFFACAAGMSAAYLLMLWRVWGERESRRKELLAAFLLALAFRAPLAGAPVAPQSDMVRYLWDGRLQRLGFNPYQYKPDDPAVAAAHTDLTREMPSRRAGTPYQPAAQLFFRLVVTLHDSTLAMKIALTLCDVLTIVVLWRWLMATGQPEWLALGYAWNPLVVLEVAHSGHIDALGALWIAASAYWLARRRTALASLAFVLAVATKLLPLVLAPLYWRRVRTRDALAAAAFLALLYLTFTRGGSIAIGTVPGVVQHVRFNGPFFRWIGRATSPQAAAVFAVGIGVAAAIWARWRLTASNPAAWAWPMALALVWAPVIYPWYLLYLTPFLLTPSTLPLIVWTFAVIPTYVVWELVQEGAPWAVPTKLMIVEYAVVFCSLAVLAFARLRRGRTRENPTVPAA